MHLLVHEIFNFLATILSFPLDFFAQLKQIVQRMIHSLLEMLLSILTLISVKWARDRTLSKDMSWFTSDQIWARNKSSQAWFYFSFVFLPPSPWKLLPRGTEGKWADMSATDRVCFLHSDGQHVIHKHIPLSPIILELLLCWASLFVPYRKKHWRSTLSNFSNKITWKAPWDEKADL